MTTREATQGRPWRPANGWGPEGRRAALSLTFDNFGEAADLEMGWWKDRPIGRHPTAAFSKVLAEFLGTVRATYFVEASNVDLYPNALRCWAAAGHEIGIHAWRHEFWDRCPPSRRREILARAQAAFASLGVTPIGFRPPGGSIAPETWGEFEEASLLYCSPLDEPGARRVGDMISLPFRWPDVDVFMIDERLGFQRVKFDRPEVAASLAEWRATALASLQEAVDDGAHRVIIFHPHSLEEDPARLAIVGDVIAAAQAAKMWIAPMNEVARFVAAETGLTKNTKTAAA